MSDHDDDLLRRYRELPREETPPALDASILAASRRATRKPLPRWAAPFSVAAVLVLALGLVLKVQRDAPEVALPSPPQEQAIPGTAVAPATPDAALADSAKEKDSAQEKDVQAPAVVQGQAAAPAKVAPPRKAEKPQAPKLTKSDGPMHVEPGDLQHERAASEAKRQDLRVTPFAPEPPVAPSADTLANSNAAPPPAASAPSPRRDAITTTTATVPPPAASRMQSSARVAAAPAATAKEAAPPELRELERIARLRAEGKDDEADAALEAFRRAHPDYRIEPAMWEKVRRR